MFSAIVISFFFGNESLIYALI